MNIGQIAKRSGISAKMIRYYEQTGLIAPVQRSAAGYRVYSDQDLKTLQFIVHAKQLGFATEQIKALLGLWLHEHRQSASVKHLAQQHIQQLKQKIASLQHMVAVLEQSVAACAGDEHPQCCILDQLEQGV
ncbi:Cu(I)-responsive transcriptional regulator [Acinetobacter larvae]|uniref:Cu(I)-responsive transcriptional regulator n=1 Tax=Acinetobacter larvae TaxID=1789224 RepID=A0A1B2M0P4_9GAMM|nr:Cu(I)-responsive transcriptional regulator [Acinetobacter larvae]AOA58776.1 Cu(I)-responsive transcriptional regulator [Acinetobacter larvae]